jgi:hypothetical protein
MAKERGRIFEFAVLHHPKPKKAQDGEFVTDPSILIVQPKMVVAGDEKEVAIMAAREIPKEFIDNNKLNEVEIAVRPF